MADASRRARTPDLDRLSTSIIFGDRRIGRPSTPPLCSSRTFD
jgi:hypothetical protein